MRIFRALLAGILAILFTGTLAPLEMASAVTCLENYEIPSTPPPSGSVTKYVTCGGDDVSYQIPLRNSVLFGGTRYTTLYATTNSIITFGDPDNNYSSWPTTPSISLYAWDWKAVPAQRPDEHFDITISDGGFQIDLSARVCCQGAGSLVNVTITGILNSDGTIALSYSKSGTVPAEARLGVVQSRGAQWVSMESYGVTQVSTPPPVPAEPVASISWTDQTLATNITRGNSYSDSIAASGTGTITYSIVGISGSLLAGQTAGLPPFLTLNSTTGAVTGTAPPNTSADGVYRFALRATAVSGSSTVNSSLPEYTITVGAGPSLSALNISRTISNGATIASISVADTTGYPTPTYTMSGTLPAGLTFNSGSATITGTPTAQGVSSVTFTATNTFGSSTSTTQTITVNRIPTFSAGTQTITSSVIKGVAYTTSIYAPAWPAPVYSVKTGALPPGITLNPSTGVISGTGTTNGVYSFVISATNDLGSSDTPTLDLHVRSAPSIVNDVISLTGYISFAYSAQPVFDGFPILSYEIIGGPLPAGLSLNTSTGEISGTPTAAGSFTFKVRATNLVSSVDSRSYTLQINGAPVYSSTNVPAATAFGSAFTGAASFTGYVNSYELISCGCAVSGTTYDQLPPGITFNAATGAISGSTTAVGTYKFKVRAYSMNHAVYTDSSLQTVEVRSAPVWIDESFTNEVTLGASYLDGVAALSYPAATYIKTGSLPTGMSFDSATGAITGTPTVVGDYTFSITATNVVSSITKNLTLRVYQLPDFGASGETVLGQVAIGESYNDEVTSLGFPAPTYSVLSGSLPAGLQLNVSTGAITGTPSATGSYDFVIQALNAYGNDDTLSRNIMVGSAPAVNTQLTNLVGYVSAGYSGSATFTGYPLPSYAITGGALPAGLSIDPTTGVITGSPTESGDFTFSIRATNFVSSATTNSYSMHVFNVPTFTNGNALSAATILGSLYSGSVSFNSYVDAYEVVPCGCSTSSRVIDGIPSGLSINSATGVVSGVSTVTGTYKFKIRAYSLNHAIYGESPTLTIEVREAPRFVDSSISTLMSAGETYSDGVSAVSYPSSTYAIVGDFPAGLRLNQDTGAITGTPTTPGSYNFGIRATNMIGTAITSEFNLMVTQAPLPVDSSIPTEAMRNAEFSDGITFTAYPAPTFSIASGTLPAGLVLNSETGAITGLPRSLGAYTFTIGINAGAYYSYTTSSFNLNIEQAPLATDSTIAAIASVGKSYTDAVAVESFPAATFAITSGSLPRGLSLDSVTGAISGSATETGEFPFTITATNIRGSKLIPLSLSSREAPSKPQVTLASSMTLGESLEGTTAVTGYPAPTFSVVNGSLPAGLSLNRNSGRISGTPSEAGNFAFSVAATNDQGTSTSALVALAIAAPEAQIDIKVSVGEPALGAPVSVASEGLEPNSDYSITVRSDPQVVGSGRTSRLGEILAKVKIPDNLEPGWHSITLETTGADGKPLKEVAWFEITATGLLEDVQPEEPTSSEKKSALTDDNKFYEEIGVDPGTQVEPEAVASTVQEVSSVVASVALVSAAAAATAAVASAASAAAAAAGASAAAGSAASAGASGSMSSGGGSSPTRAPSSGGSGSTGSSSSGGSSSSSARAGAPSGGGTTVAAAGPDGDGGDGGEGADYGNLEADHDDFTVENNGWGDRLAWWTAPFMTFMDKISVEATEHTSKISPVFSRIINDGAYLRAMFGGLMAVPYLVAIALGALSVDVNAKGLAGAGNVALLSIILILGTLDAFAGLLGIIAFAVVSISIFGIHSLGDVRYLLAMTIAAFAPIILSTTFRKIRRPAIGNISDVWERVIDVFMIAFVASLATLSVVGGISAFAGATVPLANNAKNLVFVITGVALARILLEEFAAKAFSGRLDRINPTEVSGAGTLQQWISLVFKYSVLVVMIGDMVGWGWWLWTGALIMFVPGIIGMTFQDLPKSKILTQIIPGGLAALLLATLLSSWSGDLVGAALKGSDMYGPLSFLLVPLPVIIVAIVGMFADGGDKWYVERNLKWVYVLGGIGVFVSTVWATDFVGQIFG